MELTVGKLREIIKDLDDNVMLADLGRCSNYDFRPYAAVKRVYLLQFTTGEQYLTINTLGTHFTGEKEQVGLKIIKHFDML